MNSGQNQDGQCIDHLGSRSSQNLISQCSQCTRLPQEPRLGHTEEDQWINQCSQCNLQDSRWGYTGEESWISQYSQCQHSDSRGAGRLPIPTHGNAHLSQSYTRWSHRAEVRINGSVSFEVSDFNFTLTFCVMHVLLHVKNCAVIHSNIVSESDSDTLGTLKLGHLGHQDSTTEMASNSAATATAAAAAAATAAATAQQLTDHALQQH
eukprot:6483153-Amphidinium_carterae.1